MADGAGGGGGGEAPKRRRPEDEATLAALRKEASEQHGAPAELPDECLRSWIKFATGKPELVVVARGMFLKTLGPTEESNYHVYFNPVYTDGRFKLKCRAFNCGSVHSFFAMKDKRLQPIFTDAKRHVLLCPGRPLLTEQDWAIRGLTVVPASSSSSSSASASSIKDSPVAHLSALGLTTEVFRKTALDWLLCDGRPLSYIESNGVQQLFKTLHLPLFSARTMNRLFDSEYDSLVVTPSKTILRVWRRERTLIFGGVRFLLQHKTEVSADGVSLGDYSMESVAARVAIVDRPMVLVKKEGSLFPDKVPGEPQLIPRMLPLAMGHWRVSETRRSASPSRFSMSGSASR